MLGLLFPAELLPNVCEFSAYLFALQSLCLMEVACYTLAEATTAAPYLDYARCVDAGNRPANHSGDWPTVGEMYPVRVVESRLEGIPLVHVLTFDGSAPYYNAFAPHRFELTHRVFLN